MRKAPREDEISFFHTFTGERITETLHISGKVEVVVLYEDEINEIFIDGTRADLDLNWERGCPYDVCRQELRERALM